MDSSSKSNGPQLSKWHLAIALGIGTPVALGLAYWYIKNRRDKKTQQPSDEEAAPQTVQNSQKSKNERPVDATENGQLFTSESPHEKAKAFKNNGNKLFKEGKFDKAVECYTNAIKICPPEEKSDLATFYQNRAAAYENLKNYTETINDCSKALELNKDYIKALQRRARSYEAIGNLEKCLEDITAVCMMEGFRNQPSLLLTDRVLKKLSKTKAREMFKNRVPCLPSKHFIRHYFISFSEDPIMKSVEEYKKEQEEKKSAQLSGFRQVIRCLAEEKFDDVIPNCAVEIERDGPDTPEALLVRGTFKLLQGQTDDALSDLQQLLSIESVDIKVRVNGLIKMGTLKVQLEKMEDALEDFNKAIELDRNNSDIYLHRGQVYLLMDRIDDTLKDMEKSSSLNPNFPSARAQKCYIQYRCGIQYNDPSQKVAALAGFEEIKQKFPSCSETYFLYAQVLTECAEYEKSEEFFKKAGELDPSDPNVFVHRGILLLQWKQDINAALELLNKAIEMDEKCQFAYETLGSVEVQRGNLERGLELFQKAVQLAHTEAELAHLLSLLQAAQAQAKAAKKLGINLGSFAQSVGI